MTFPSSDGYSYLWGTTRSTFVSPDYALEMVVTPYLFGTALPEQFVTLTNDSGDLPLHDWLYLGGPATSATARFEFTRMGTNVVLASQPTSIDVDPY